MQTQSTTPALIFNSFFEAETHLEKQGYHCQHYVWKDNHNHFATVVASDNNVRIEFIHSGKKH